MRWARVWAVVLAVGSGALGGCDDSGPPMNPFPDSGTVDAGTVDAGTSDAGGSQGDDGGTQVDVDAGTDAGSLGEPLPCEKTQGVCAGARRAVVDGAYESVCTALSYGSAYEATESRCDGLDNDCDGVTDPPTWSQATSLALPAHGGRISTLRVTDGVLAVVVDRASAARVIRLDTEMKPLEVTEVPLAIDGTAVSLDSVSARLLRTAQGPALYYASAGPSADRLRGYLIRLDEQGHRVRRDGEPAGGTLLFDEPRWDMSSVATVSADGTRVLTAWRDNVVSLGGRDLWGTLVELSGQVVVSPRILMRALADDTTLRNLGVMGLRDGGFLALVQEIKEGAPEGLLRLQHFDAALKPVGDERTFSAEADPETRLVDLGAAAGGALESPVIVLRSVAGGERALKVLGNLFGEATTHTLAVTTSDEVPWYGTAVTARGLEAAWLSVSGGPQGGNSAFGWQGRFWALGQGGIAKDLSPGPDFMPLHRFAQWVQLEELPEHWMGALVMTSTQSPESHTLQAVRYCAP